MVGDEPFAVILADDLIDDGSTGCLAQMVRQFEQQGCSLLGVEEIAPTETDKLARVDAMIEKPKPEIAPSTLAVVGRYILNPRIFDLLATQPVGAGGEIQRTDAIARLLKESLVLAYRFEGKRYDCGSKLGYLEATVQYALKHPELGRDFKNYLRSLNGDFVPKPTYTEDQHPKISMIKRQAP